MIGSDFSQLNGQLVKEQASIERSDFILKLYLEIRSQILQAKLPNCS